MKHVVMFSGGIASWGTARAVREKYGPDDMILLFTDTKMEDEDLYRFLDEAATDIGVPLIKIAEGRTPWEVFFDERLLGNTRMDPCSRILKRELARKWIKDNCDLADTIVHLGFDWTEEHRFIRSQVAWQPWRTEALLCGPPWKTRTDLIVDLERSGIRMPRLYQFAAHNNCGGFCIKAGHGAFISLLRAMPERYAFHENKEQEFREYVGKDVSILRDREGGDTKPLTLKTLREKYQSGHQIDMFDIGGCGCFEDHEQK